MVPPVSDARWRAFVLSQTDYPFKELATKIMHNRVKGLARKQTEDAIQEAVTVAHSFFLKNEVLAAADLKTIFG